MLTPKDTPPDTSRVAAINAIPVFSDAITSEASRSFARVFGSTQQDRVPAVRAPLSNTSVREERGLSTKTGSVDPAPFLLDMPSHVLPPIDTLAARFLDLLLGGVSGTGTGTGAGTQTPAKLPPRLDVTERTEEPRPADTPLPTAVEPCSLVHVPEDSMIDLRAKKLDFMVDFFRNGCVSPRTTEPPVSSTKTGKRKGDRSLEVLAEPVSLETLPRGGKVEKLAKKPSSPEPIETKRKPKKMAKGGAS